MTWPAQDNSIGQGDHHTPKAYVRQAFRKYLQWASLPTALPGCNTRRMVEAAAHLGDHVFPRLPVRQWVLSVPKRLGYFMQREAAQVRIHPEAVAEKASLCTVKDSPGVWASQPDGTSPDPVTQSRRFRPLQIVPRPRRRLLPASASDRNKLLLIQEFPNRLHGLRQ